jgi:pyrrolidone-carboxylate peptidase
MLKIRRSAQGLQTCPNLPNLLHCRLIVSTCRCPDQAGWQPSGLVIEQGQGLGLSSVRSSSLPVQQLAQELHSAGFDCHVSRDAGRCATHNDSALQALEKACTSSCRTSKQTCSRMHLPGQLQLMCSLRLIQQVHPHI